MLKRMPPGRAKQLVEAATLRPRSDPRVSYPGWYLHRWHFLPEGYLSRRSAAGYDLVIRHVYNQFVLESRTIRAAVAAVGRLRPSSLIEVGCGPGHLLRAAAEANAAEQLVGVDLSPYLLERAERRLKGRHVRLAHADALSLPADEGSFDVAVASHVLGHLPKELRASALSELARVVRPGGHVLLLDHRWHDKLTNAALRLREQTAQSLGFIQMSVFERIEPVSGAS